MCLYSFSVFDREEDVLGCSKREGFLCGLCWFSFANPFATCAVSSGPLCSSVTPPNFFFFTFIYFFFIRTTLLVNSHTNEGEEGVAEGK